MDTPLLTYLERAGWRRSKQDPRLWLAPGKRRYLLFGEERPQPAGRYLPALLAEALLRARAGAQGHSDVEPVAYLSLDRLTPLVDARLSDFIDDVAPTQSWLAFDANGTFLPHVRGAPELPAVRGAGAVRPAPRRTNLFSDHNQWLLKVLLGRALPDKWLSVPRDTALRNATMLAAAARVSIPVAARFVKALEAEGHLNTRQGDLRVDRPLELLELWRNRLVSTVSEESVGQYARGSLDDREFRALMLTAAERPQIVLGLFGAAEALGLGHVRGAPRYVYFPTLEPADLSELGFVAGGGPSPTDLIVAAPLFPEATFRASVIAAGRRVTDVIQTWLDTSHHPLRGEEQASVIWRKALQPALRDE